MNNHDKTTVINEKRQYLLRLAESVFYQFNRIFLRHSVIVPELRSILEWTAARAAMHESEFSVPGRTDKHAQSVAHAAFLTGLPRGRFKKIADLEESPVQPDDGDLNNLLRILTAWRTEPFYQDKDGNPRVINLNGRRPSLHQLRLRYAHDTTTRAVADALVMHGCAEWVDGNDVQSRGKQLRYLQPVVTENPFNNKGFAIHIQIASDFMHSFQQAFKEGAGTQPQLREGYFNDIAIEKRSAAKQFLDEEIQAFNVRITEGLKRFRAAPGAPSVRMGAGSYSINDAPLFAPMLSNATPMATPVPMPTTTQAPDAAFALPVLPSLMPLLRLEGPRSVASQNNVVQRSY